MKTLFFVLAVFLFCPNWSLATAPDPYVSLPWHSVRTGDIPEVRSIASSVATIEVFQKVLTGQNVSFTMLLTQCGMPSAECDYERVKNIHDMPSFSNGHFFRYDLIDSGHVYIWTGNERTVTLAIYYPKAGPEELLYK